MAAKTSVSSHACAPVWIARSDMCQTTTTEGVNALACLGRQIPTPHHPYAPVPILLSPTRTYKDLLVCDLLEVMLTSTPTTEVVHRPNPSKQNTLRDSIHSEIQWGAVAIYAQNPLRMANAYANSSTSFLRLISSSFACSSRFA